MNFSLQQFLHLFDEARRLGQHISCYCLEFVASHWNYVQFIFLRLG